MFVTPRAQSQWRRYLLGLVALLLLAQTAERNHLHDDLEASNDCYICCCLHHGNNDVASASSTLPAQIATLSHLDAEHPKIDTALPTEAYSIRAPPLSQPSHS